MDVNKLLKIPLHVIHWEFIAMFYNIFSAHVENIDSKIIHCTHSLDWLHTTFVVSGYHSICIYSIILVFYLLFD